MNLRDERQRILTDAALKHELQDRVEDLAAFLDEQTEAVSEYSELWHGDRSGRLQSAIRSW